MASITAITSEAQFHESLSGSASTKLIVLYFHTPWAAPCAQMQTILETLAPAHSPSAVAFLSINAEDLPDVSESYDVTAVPFLVLLKDGKTVETVNGSDATRVREVIERHAGRSGTTKGDKMSLPPAQAVDPSTANKSHATNGHSTTDVSSHTRTDGDAASAPEMTGSATSSQEELHQRLSSLVKAAPVMLFMKGTPSGPQCGFSRQLVGLLREKSVRYGFFNILADDEVRQGLKEFADWPTFPQLWVDGELVGGLDIVKEEFGNDATFLDDYTVKASKGSSTATVTDRQPATV